jgi:hypothetical protein
MATDGPDPTPCNPDIFENGRAVFMTHSIPSNAMEHWVKMVAERSGEPVDWHFAGGRAVVLTTGDVRTVRAAIKTLLPEHDEAWRKGVARYGKDFADDPPPRGFIDDEAP